MNMREAAEATRRLQHLAGGDPYGVRTIAGARGAFLRDEIDVVEFERRVELFLSGKPTAVVGPGEWVIPLRQS